MAYDEARREIVLFGGGGRGQPFLQDTWTWDGKNWSQRNPATSPPAAGGPTLLYDAKLGRIVALVDAAPTADTVTQTWTWDGNTWAQLHPSIELGGPRFATGAAYDAAHGSVVVFGMSTFDAGADTWTFDGETWARHLASPGGPTAGLGATMAYEGSTSKVVMFGGADASGNVKNETWTWDGTRWTQARPSASPWPRLYARTATDAAGHVVLFGGLVATQIGFNYSDVWTWKNGSWTLIQPTSAPAATDEGTAILAAASMGFAPSGCEKSNPPCVAVRGQPQLGFWAAYVIFDLTPPSGTDTLCVSYVSYVVPRDAGRAFATGPWHQVALVCSPSIEGVMQLGSHAKVHVTGCANVRSYPQSGAVLSCLPNGTSVIVDEGPFAMVDNSERLWWHLQGRGWMAHELLVAA